MWSLPIKFGAKCEFYDCENYSGSYKYLGEHGDLVVKCPTRSYEVLGLNTTKQNKDHFSLLTEPSLTSVKHFEYGLNLHFVPLNVLVDICTNCFFVTYILLIFTTFYGTLVL